MSDATDSRSRGRLLAVAVLVSVFMAGGLTAAAVIQVLRVADGPEPPPTQFQAPGMGPGMGPGPARGMRGGPPPGPGLAPMAMSRRMAQRLGLSRAQQEEIRQILEHRRQVSDSIMGRVLPELRAQMDSVRDEVREILTPEQRELFDRWNQEGREGLFRRFPGDSARGG